MKNLFKRTAAWLSAFSLIGTVVTVPVTVNADNDTTTITPTMTYVDYSEADKAYGYIAAGETAKTGYNSFNGTIGFGNTKWGVNYITYLKIDASSITDTVVSATLTFDAGQISARGAAYGLVNIAYTDWDNTLTYNIANTLGMRTGIGYGSTVSVGSGSGTKSVSFSIGDWISNDADKILTVAVYQTSAGGGSVANPSLTVETTTDPDYIQPIASVAISGAESMSYGSDADTAYSNPYSVVITGSSGGTINENNISSKVTDFNVAWDIDGFKTENDTDGQYCDSYGEFSKNNTATTSTNFDIRGGVEGHNYYGRMKATVTYNGKTFTAEKYVIVLGDKSTSGRLLPDAGYPSDFDDYPSALVGYSAKRETFGGIYDTIVGGWIMAGSFGSSTAIIEEEGANKYLRVTTDNGTSHAFSNAVSTPTQQAIFKQRVRFISGKPNLSLNTKVYSANNTCAVILQYDNGKLTLNEEVLTDSNDNTASINKNTWYDVIISADKTNETCYAMVYDTSGSFVGGTDNVAWRESCNPEFYTIGSPDKTAGTIDFDDYSAYYAAADVNNYTLTPSQDTLSIPNNDTADLTAALYTAEGYPMTGAATWTVLEEDMQEGVIITPNESDSHKATVSLSDTAEAGTATVQVSIGGYTKTIELNITSSDESVKFTKSNASVSIPLDSTANTAEFAAAVVDGSGVDTGAAVTLGVYDKNNTSEYTLPSGISFDAATGILSVESTAPAVTFTIRATGLNSKGESISKGIKVTVHGLSFDFGAGTDADVAEGFTAVSPTTSYTEARGYGIASGSLTAGGSASTDDAAADYLSGAMTFKANVTKGKIYTVDIVYSGTLTTGYVNSDLAGYELGTNTSLASASYEIAVPVDVLDLKVAGDDAKIASVKITKNADKTPNAKPDIHHVGDSTSANKGSWAYRLSKLSYADLSALATFYNNGAGGRNLCTYYTEGKLASVLKAIEPGDILMFGNNGTNGMGNSFEEDVNFYLDAAEAMGANIIINSYTPHGAVSNYASGYNSSTNTFNSYRQDRYDKIVRQIAEERAASDPNYLGFVEIGKNADAIFTAYAADYAANGYASADEAAQAIIACFPDHNHYNNDTLACDLMLNGYGDVKGIVSQLVEILGGTYAAPEAEISDPIISKDESGADAVGYIATYTQNLYEVKSITWHVTHADGDQSMDIKANDMPKASRDTSIRLGLILLEGEDGKIDDIGDVKLIIE